MSAVRKSLEKRNAGSRAFVAVLAEMDLWQVKKVNRGQRLIIFKGPGHASLKADVWRGRIDDQMRLVLQSINNEKYRQSGVDFAAPYTFAGRKNRGSKCRFVVFSRAKAADVVLRFHGAPPSSLLYRLREVCSDEGLEDEKHRHEGEREPGQGPRGQGQGPERRHDAEEAAEP